MSESKERQPERKILSFSLFPALSCALLREMWNSRNVLRFYDSPRCVSFVSVRGKPISLFLLLPFRDSENQPMTTDFGQCMSDSLTAQGNSKENTKYLRIGCLLMPSQERERKLRKLKLEKHYEGIRMIFKGWLWKIHSFRFTTFERKRKRQGGWRRKFVDVVALFPLPRFAAEDDENAMITM